MTLGDRIIVMRKGGIAQVGTPRDIYFEPQSRFVAEFIGAANIVSGTAKEGVLLLPGGRLVVGEETISGPVTAMVRPEAISIINPDVAALTGRVETVNFEGGRQRVTVMDIGGRPITVDAPNTILLKPGEMVGLTVNKALVRILPQEPAA
jgi:putative spermidine/putrescine transport system ATP-binding protein